MEVNPDTHFILPLTIGQAQRILNVLAEMPFKDVADLVILLKQCADAAVIREQNEKREKALDIAVPKPTRKKK